MFWCSSGSMTALSASRTCSSVGIARQSGKESYSDPQIDRPGTRPGRSEGGEILRTTGDMRPAVLPRAPLSPGRVGVKRVAYELVVTCSWTRSTSFSASVLQAVHVALEVTARALDLLLDLTPVALHEARGLRAALTELALHLRAGPLHLAEGPVAGGVAATLEALQLTLDAGAGLEALGGLDQAVTGDERRANRDQDGAAQPEWREPRRSCAQHPRGWRRHAGRPGCAWRRCACESQLPSCRLPRGCAARRWWPCCYSLPLLSY